MRAHGYATVCESHGQVSHIGGHAGWYRQLTDWWATRQAARRQAHLAMRDARWDGQHETVRPLRIEAALEMAIAQGVFSMATQPYSLIQ
jgi:hypothetical protein